LPSIGAHALPFLNFDFLRPVRFSAVYFPAWFVNGEVEANVTYKGIQGKETAWFENTYIPGSDMAVLSAAPLKCPIFKGIETVPFTKFLLHQHGEPVQCIPFSTLPFSVLDVAASHPPSRSITINEDLSIDPSSVKLNMISAYPVLLPLYLAQYEIQDGQGNKLFTFILQAHTLPGSVMCENISNINETSKKAIDIFSEFVGRESAEEVYTFSPVTPRVSIPDISIPPPGRITNSIKEWLEELLSSSSNIETLAESSLGVMEKGDEDLRIRELTTEEIESMEKYTELTMSIMFFKRFLKSFPDRPTFEIHLQNPQTLELGKGQMPKRVVGKQLERLEAQRAEFAPHWWSEWLALNRPELKKSRDEDAAGTPKDKAAD